MDGRFIVEDDEAAEARDTLDLDKVADEVGPKDDLVQSICSP